MVRVCVGVGGWVSEGVRVFAAAARSERPPPLLHLHHNGAYALCPRVFLGCRGNQVPPAPGSDESANQSQPEPPSLLAPVWLAWLPCRLELANHRQPVRSVTRADHSQPSPTRQGVTKPGRYPASVPHPAALSNPDPEPKTHNRPQTKPETRWLLANPWRAPDAVTLGVETAPFPLQAPNARTGSGACLSFQHPHSGRTTRSITYRIMPP